LNLVLDASVIVKVYIPEELSEKADLLFQKIGRERISLIAPDLIYPETGNILWKKKRLKELKVSDVKVIADAIQTIPFIIIPSKSVIQLAIDIGMVYDITVYDAIYVSVAQIFEATFITADKKLVNALRKTDLKDSIEWLGVVL
jgi:predicted nucleic acid-binding protein